MILLYRPSLDFSSGAGQLMRMQLRALHDAGERAEIGCARGALKFWLRSGARARRISVRAVRDAARERFVVDHGLCVPKRPSCSSTISRPRRARTCRGRTGQPRRRRNGSSFAELRADALLVANSRLVADALCARFGAAPERVVVQHPGFQAARFNPSRAAELRASARRELGIAPDSPLVGLITSGDFEKRGLDVFVARSRAGSRPGEPDARFLVVGSKSLPAAVRGHALVGTGRLLYRPKSRAPERWFAALDLFLYPALFEEFGMVVLEAQAVGLPIVTSRRVGAAECLPPAYEPWLAERPLAGELAERVLALLADAGARARALGRGPRERARVRRSRVRSPRARRRSSLRSGGSSRG